MKILYHHRTMGRGAEGVHIVSMVKAFKALGNQVIIMSPPSVNPLKEAGEDVFNITRKSSKGVTIFGHYLKLFSRRVPQFVFEILEIFYNLYSAITIIQSINRFAPDLFYERYAFFSFISGSIARKRRIPYVLEVNEISGLKRFRGQSFIGLTGWVEKRIFKNADIIIVVSSFLKKKIIEKGISEKKVMILPNGVDINIFSPNHIHHDIKKQYGVSDTDILIGFVGWFAEWDRLDKLIHIFKDLSGSYNNAKLILVGDGHIRSHLQQNVDKLGLVNNVYFTGAVPRKEVYKYISAIDIGVFPHSNEFGSPIVLFEFMAMGKPVVAPALDPITDVIEDKIHGLTFPPGDFNLMLEALHQLIDDEGLRSRLGSAAREEIINKHSWKRKAETILMTIGNRKSL